MVLNNDGAARLVLPAGAASPKPAEMPSVARLCAAPPSSDARLSDTLEALAGGCAGERISFDDLTAALGHRCFAGLLFVFAAPNLLPLPPGASGVLGVPLVLLSLQMLLGYRRPWFPEPVLRRDIGTEHFASVVSRLAPISRRAERLLRPRLKPLTALLAHRAVALLCFLLGLVIALPIPLGNVVPAAAVSAFALGLLARDGVAVILGLALTAASVAIVSGVALGAAAGMRAVLDMTGL